MTVSGPTHTAVLTRREALLFEAGIKLGGVFHQYLGTPVSPRTAPALARAIEAAVGLQPFVRSVRVRIDPRRAGRPGRGRFAYQYLTAEMLDVTVGLVDGPLSVEARLKYRPELRYPLMSVARIGHRRRVPRAQ
ncbi:MAG TPA: dihydroneopterin aldolase family protein [Thermoplasmata archaeon]|nr:dihydroneopterin aldolase family protein [Thermoplasmata archaeon]